MTILGFVSLVNSEPKTGDKPNGKWLKKLPEALVNSAIVAGITFFSVLGATRELNWQAALIAFGLTFFTKLALNLGIK